MFQICPVCNAENPTHKHFLKNENGQCAVCEGSGIINSNTGLSPTLHLATLDINLLEFKNKFNKILQFREEELIKAQTV